MATGTHDQLSGLATMLFFATLAVVIQLGWIASRLDAILKELRTK